MTNNPYGLKIELNVSNDIAYLENILSHQANKSALIGCHNFIRKNSLVFRTIISFAVVNALKSMVFAVQPLLHHMPQNIIHGILTTDYVR